MKNKRIYRVHAVREGRATKRLPNELTMEFETFGPASALKRFQWAIEERYGRKAMKKFPHENLKIEEI